MWLKAGQAVKEQILITVLLFVKMQEWKKKEKGYFLPSLLHLNPIMEMLLVSEVCSSSNSSSKLISVL
jgi:hypothetical protein